MARLREVFRYLPEAKLGAGDGIAGRMLTNKPFLVRSAIGERLDGQLEEHYFWVQSPSSADMINDNHYPLRQFRPWSSDTDIKSLIPVFLSQAFSVTHSVELAQELRKHPKDAARWPNLLDEHGNLLPAAVSTRTSWYDLLLQPCRRRS